MRTSNLAIIQGRILGRKECVFTQKLLREKSWLSIKVQDHQGKEHLPWGQLRPRPSVGRAEV